MIGSYAIVGQCISYNEKWTRSHSDSMNSICQTVGNAGAMLGAFTADWLLVSRLGKKNAHHVLNVIVIAGICMQFTPNMIVFDIGKVLQGYAAGAFSVVSPAYIAELAPLEFNATIGGVN